MLNSEKTPIQVQTLKYFTLNPQQCIEFINAIKARVKSENLKSEKMTTENWKEFGKEMKKLDLCNRIDTFYEISNNSNKKDSIGFATNSIIAFLDKYFGDIDFDTVKTYGTFSDEKSNGQNEIHKSAEPDIQPAHKAIQSEKWVLLTFGEKETKIAEFENEIKRRRYYIKQRPVVFSGPNITNLKQRKRIHIDNSDDPDNPQGNVNHYVGGCEFFTKNKRGNPIFYLETEPMQGNSGNERHLRLLLCFGELKDNQFSELALGTFTGIRDGGGLFAGVALLVKASAMNSGQIGDENSVARNVMDLSKIYFHESFIDKPVQAAIRIFLERKNKSFIKLPKLLKEFTLEELKKSLIRLKDNEIKNYATREVMIYRKNAFISTPFFNNSNTIGLNSDKQFLDEMVELLKKEPFNMIGPQSISHGLSNDSNSTTYLAFENNFEHIRQSRCFIFVLRDINNRKNISSSFIELGFAIGIRKKCILICTTAMKKKLPKAVSTFLDGNKILLIENESENGNVNDPEEIGKLLTSKNNSILIKEFLKNSYRITEK